MDDLLKAGTNRRDFRKGARGSFKAYAWHLPEEGCDNIFQMFMVAKLERTKRPDDPEGSLANFAKITIAEGAQRLKDFMVKKPEGGRAILPVMSRMFSDPDGSLSLVFDNWFWWDEGVKSHIELYKELFSAYREIGGPEIDSIIYDYEIGCDAFNIAWNKISGGVLITEEEKEKRYQGFIDDPRYTADLRPGLAAMGFEFYKGADHNELYHYWHHPGRPNTEAMKNFYIGIVYAQERKCRYLNRLYTYIRDTFYSRHTSSNYGNNYALYNPDFPSSQHQYSMFDTPEQGRGSGMAASPFGTHNSPILYGKIAADEMVPPGTAYPFALFRKTPYNGMLKMILIAQSCLLYCKNSKMMPWIPNYSWSYKNQLPFYATEYFKEFILHLGLYNPDPMLYFNAFRDEVAWSHDDLLLSGLLHELDEVAGFENRRSLVEGFTPSYRRYLLSGMHAGGRNVWRITPDIYTPDTDVPGGHVTAESFLVCREVPEFRIGNQVVKFPAGSFIYKPEESHSACGYWVISPEGTKPDEYEDAKFAPPAETDFRYVEGENLAKLKVKMA